MRTRETRNCKIIWTLIHTVCNLFLSGTKDRNHNNGSMTHIQGISIQETKSSKSTQVCIRKPPQLFECILSAVDKQCYQAISKHPTAVNGMTQCHLKLLVSALGMIWLLGMTLGNLHLGHQILVMRNTCLAIISDLIKITPTVPAPW